VPKKKILYLCMKQNKYAGQEEIKTGLRIRKDEDQLGSGHSLGATTSRSPLFGLFLFKRGKQIPASFGSTSLVV